ncbi:flippase [Thermodesulfobacteriota bacterium]
MLNFNNHTRNTLYNLIGFVIPMIVAIIAIPQLIEVLGVERFGVLTIAWMVIGYFSFLNLGIGRATTKLLAESIAHEKYDKIRNTLYSSILLLFIGGSLGCLIIQIISPILVYSFLEIPNDLTSEAITSLRLLGLTLPFVLGSEGFRGALEAQDRFGLVNAVKIPASIANFALPLIIIQYSNSLVLVVTTISVARLFFFFVYMAFCINSIAIYPKIKFSFIRSFKRLLSFGGWVSISSIVNPIMTYLDRFFIGSTLGIAAVTYYSVPYDFVMKLLVISGSLTIAVFPTFSGYSGPKNYKILKTYRDSLFVVALVMSTITIIGISLTGILLELWLGYDFAQKSTLLTQILLVGVYINSLAGIPFSFIQAAGRPDITAKLHLIELPFYLFLLFTLTPRLGLVGVSAAWSIRVIVDSILLFYMSEKLFLAKSDVSFNFKYVPILIFTAMIIIIVCSVLKLDIYYNCAILFLCLSFIFFIFLKREFILS